MADQDVVRHYLRLNLQNEQHRRIHDVLERLNKDIHKSENQFIIKAIDFYIRSFEDEDIVDRPHQKKKKEYVTAEELAQVRREIENDVKEELIRILGSVVAGSFAGRVTGSMKEPVQEEEAEDNDPYAAEAANRWG